MEYLISITTIFVECLSLMNLCNAFFKTKVSTHTKYIAVIIYTFIQVTITHLFFKDLTIIKTIMVLLFTCIYAKSIYKAKTVSITFSVFIYYIFNIICDYIVVIIVPILMNISLPDIYQSISAYIVLASISKFLLFIGTFYFEKFWSQKNAKTDILLLEWLQLMIFPCVSIIILITMVYTSIKEGNSAFWTIAITLGIFIANIVTMFLISRLSEDKRIKQDNIMLQQQVRMNMENVQMLMAAYDSQRKLTHDFNNHLGALNILISKNEIKAALKYIHNLEIPTGELPTIIKSNNPFIDAVLNYKYMIARKKNIFMEFNINDLSEIPIDDEDIVAILGNALDNAIEASDKCKENRKIKIKIFKEKYETILSIQNTIAEPVKILDGYTIKTTKENSLNHGYGINNIKNILNKYESTFTMTTNSKWFQITIIIH